MSLDPAFRRSNKILPSDGHTCHTRHHPKTCRSHRTGSIWCSYSLHAGSRTSRTGTSLPPPSSSRRMQRMRSGTFVCRRGIDRWIEGCRSYTKDPPTETCSSCTCMKMRPGHQTHSPPPRVGTLRMSFPPTVRYIYIRIFLFPSSLIFRELHKKEYTRSHFQSTQRQARHPRHTSLCAPSIVSPTRMTAVQEGRSGSWLGVCD